ncbi:MAG: GAF domain-containing protein [Caldilineaceae bacterium]
MLQPYVQYYVQYISNLSRRHLRLVGIVFALLLWGMLTLLHFAVDSQALTSMHIAMDFVMVLAGSLLFSTWLARAVQRHEDEIQHRIAHLEALHAAALAVTSEVELSAVLQKVVDLSRSLLQAEYGALSVLDGGDGEIQEFVTSGMDETQRRRIGVLPRHLGILGVAIKTNESLRIADLAQDARTVGFPTHHPPMRSLLAVPVTSKGRTIGTLFLADKMTTNSKGLARAGAFSQEDEDLLFKFATQSAIAIENARLYRQAEQLAILQERERFGRDLHDGVIQSIYAVGLMLEDSQQRIESEPQLVYQRLTQTLTNLNKVIMDIRSYILDLQPSRTKDVGQRLRDLVARMSAEDDTHTRLLIEPIDPGLLSSAQAMEVMRVAQEALVNAQRHALADEIVVRLYFSGGLVHLEVEDNGVGFTPDEWALSGGLHNMKERQSS